MKTNYILLGGLLYVAAISCNSGIDQNTKPATSVQPTASLINLPSTNAITPIVNPLDTNKPVVSTSQQNAANTAINPPHGQPGHRCGVNEGAGASNPIATNSLSNLVTNATPATLKNPTLNNVQSQLPTTTSKSTGANNPAHGQPGHRCELTVGAPLSTPEKNNTTPLVSTTPTPIPQNPIVYNPQPQSTVPASKATTGLNPAHGQPGHRCDLTVGAPLNSKPTSSTVPASSSTTPVNSNTTVNQPTSSPTPLLVNTTSQLQSPLNVPLPQATPSGQNSKARINPPHGQPGHDCSVQAGKPLKQ